MESCVIGFSLVHGSGRVNHEAMASLRRLRSFRNKNNSCNVVTYFLAAAVCRLNVRKGARTSALSAAEKSSVRPADLKELRQDFFRLVHGSLNEQFTVSDLAWPRMSETRLEPSAMRCEEFCRFLR
jgi:hypothetical protein